MILYEGPSQLDGKPIIAIATVNSKNAKTGNMIQTWIMRSDMEPTAALRSGADASICGSCPQRQNLGGACYVVVHNAPLTVWRAWKRGNYSDAGHVAKVREALATIPLRMGSYGDPAAVPFGVWEALIAEGCGRFTGYTHQWRRHGAQLYRRILMASCDNDREAREARAMGWRFFLVTHETPQLGRGVVECLSDSRGLTCADCGICDGTRADSRSTSAASIAIKVHGPLAKRFALHVVK